jgi:hypothetical protein
MQILVCTPDERMVPLEVDLTEPVENVKALIEVQVDKVLVSSLITLH